MVAPFTDLRKNSFTFLFFLFHEVAGKDLSDISSNLNLRSLHPNMSHQFALLLEMSPVFQYDLKQIYVTQRGQKITDAQMCARNTVNREIPRTGTGKFNETDFDNAASIPGERELVPFARRSPCSFCHDDEASPCEWRRGGLPPTSFT